MHSVIWSAMVPLVSFECIEWHATDRFRRQFGFVQGVPHQERSLDRAHGEVLTGPKNLNWATATTHSFWDVEADQVMDDGNEEQEAQSPPPPTPPPPPPPAAEEQPHSTSQYVPQIQFPTSFPIHQPHFDSGEGGSFSQLLGFMASDAGQAQYNHQADFLAGRYSFDARYPFYTYSGASGGFVSSDSSRSDGGRGVLNSQNPNRLSMTMIEENAKTFEHETAEYLVDEPDDEEDEDDEDEDMDEEDDEDVDQDEESRNASGDTCTPGETGKGYNLRIDPPRRSASRYTPSVIKKAAKKCKNIVNFGKWTMRK
ncbi:Serine/threonine protein phosphatase 7 long form isogeny [Arachis hypogaea]|nr:Serine/threonine protein phosphatase 7 long form isogeny [Arachis hypogaea]